MNTLEQFHLKQILIEVSMETGIVVSDANFWQVQQRIKKLCAKHDIPSFYVLRQKIQQHEKYIFWDELLECVLVQESYFFRDPSFFAKLEQEIIPTLSKKCSPIRIWSAAAAQGQEIYSIAMMAHKSNNLETLELYASDISKSAIHAAESGIYTYSSLQRSIHHEDILRFFTPSQKKWKFTDELRNRVSFFQHNLLHPSNKKDFYHVIIIKNMLLYLCAESREKVLRNAQRALHKDGILVVSNPNTQLIPKDSML